MFYYIFAFSQAVLGAQGVISWITTNLAISNSVLCEKSDFCTFSEVASPSISHTNDRPKFTTHV